MITQYTVARTYVPLAPTSSPQARCRSETMAASDAAAAHLPLPAFPVAKLLRQLSEDGRSGKISLDGVHNAQPCVCIVRMCVRVSVRVCGADVWSTTEKSAMKDMVLSGEAESLKRVAACVAAAASVSSVSRVDRLLADVAGGLGCPWGESPRQRRSKSVWKIMARCWT
jgi:hypothetical protein